MSNRYDYNRLEELAKKLQEGRATSVEKAEYLTWLNELNDSVLDIPTQFADSKEVLEGRMLSYIQQQIKSPTTSHRLPTHHIHFLKAAWFRYAAAVILIAGGATMVAVLTNHRDIVTTNGNKHLQTDILPGINRAVLIIGNNKMDLAANKTGIAVNNMINYTDGTTIDGLTPLSAKREDGGEELYTLTTPRGGQYQVVLPDGSKIWLNAASSIQFPSKFEGRERAVEITGEAYLEVAKNLKQSFIVTLRQAQGNGIEIQVLGTSFNVNAYKEENAIKTTLIDGSVKVIGKTSSPLLSSTGTVNSVLLRPGQQAIINDQEEQLNKVKIVTADIAKTIAWKNGLFNFENAHLPEVLRQLERWYDIQVVYESRVPDIEFFGKINKNVPLSVVLETLQGMGVQFRVEGKKLIVL